MQPRSSRISVLVLLALVQLVLQPLVHASPCFVGTVLGTASCCCHGAGHDGEREVEVDETVGTDRAHGADCCENDSDSAAADREGAAGELATRALASGAVGQPSDCDCSVAPDPLPATPMKSGHATEPSSGGTVATELPRLVLRRSDVHAVLRVGPTPPWAQPPLQVLLQVFRL